jgi:hypothetical protein
VSENYPNVSWDGNSGPCIAVQPTTATTIGISNVYTNTFGKGLVTFMPDPDAFSRASAKHCKFQLDEDAGVTRVLVNASSEPAKESLNEAAGLPDELGWLFLDMNLSPGGTGLARYSKSGHVIAVEAQGPVTWRKRTIPMTGHWALMSCDGKDVTSSREMIVLPFGGGEIDLSLLGKGLVVQTGDVVNGKWQVLSESTSLKISASGADAFDIRIIAPKLRLAHLGEFISSELTLSPSP